MGAVWLFVRREVRGRAGSLLVLAVLIAVAAGATLAPIAGARRTERALPRLLSASEARDAVVQYPFEGEASAAELAEIGQELRGLPGVAEVSEIRQFFLFPDDGDFDSGDIAFDNQSTGSVDGGFGWELERGRVLDGSRPDPSDPGSVILGEATARRLGVVPGDRLALASLSAAQLECIFTGCALTRPEGPRVELEVASVERFVAEAFGPTNPQQMLLTPAFVERYVDEIANFGSLWAVRLDDGPDGVDRLAAQLEELVEGRGDDPSELYVTGVLDEAVGILDAADAMAVGLRVFAGLAAVVGLLVVAQALARQFAAGLAARWALDALGFTRRQRAAAALLVPLPALLLGCLGAVGVVIGVSPLFPLGQARIAEPTPGLAFDALVALGGIAATLLAVAVAATFVHRRLSVRGPGERLAATDARWLATAPPTVRSGVRAAFARGSAATAVGGSVLAVALVAGASAFGAGVDRFVGSAARDGWAWDLEVGIGDDLADDDLRAVAGEVAAEPGVTGVLAARIASIDLGDTDRPVTAIGTEAVRGTLGLTLVAGRAPVAPGEVALGAATARRLAVGVGDDVPLTGEDGRRGRHRVVGLARFPLISTDAPDEGVWTTLEALTTIARSSDGFPTLLATVAPGADGAAAVDRLRLEHPFVDGEPRRSSDAGNLAQMSGLPVALSGIGAALGSGALLHGLVVGVGRRRRELAVLRAIGFTARQVRATIRWQALALVGVAVAVGLPAGLAAGRAAWSALARAIGAADDPSTSAVVLLVVPVLAGFALLVAAGLARWAWVARPASALRSE